ncbi:hypothetical protein Tsubulata_003935 [Turnera subulata]|uniref:Uncharacterized protein n=1 Tax=Turnera subulata TaxID=218843 RepID=A0A9Q0JNM9_9ROSI|nr:hypothetical protein Tsubulata_003935 [Turnera subulata]
MAGSPSSSSSPERERKKKLRYDAVLGALDAAMGAISKPNQEADDGDVGLESTITDDITKSYGHQYSAYEDIKTDADSGDDGDVGLESTITDDITKSSAYEDIKSDADEKEGDSEDAEPDADEEEEADGEEAGADAAEEEADSGEEEEAKPEKENPLRDILPDGLKPRFDQYVEQFVASDGFVVDVNGMPVWLQHQLVRPIDLGSSKFYKSRAETVCRSVCNAANKKQKKQELKFVRVVRANILTSLVHLYYITFEARDRLDTSEGEDGTIKTYRTKATVRDTGRRISSIKANVRRWFG